MSPGSLVPVSTPVRHLLPALLSSQAVHRVPLLLARRPRPDTALRKILETLMVLLPSLQLQGVGLVLLCPRGLASLVGSLLKVLDWAPSPDTAQAVRFSKVPVGSNSPPSPKLPPSQELPVE